MNNRGSILLPYRKAWVGLPVGVFYVLAIGLSSIVWAVARGVWGLEFYQALAVLIVPFGLLIWFGGDRPDR